jgi:hypothetical protein
MNRQPSLMLIRSLLALTRIDAVRWPFAQMAQFIKMSKYRVPDKKRAGIDGYIFMAITLSIYKLWTILLNFGICPLLVSQKM